MRTDPIETRQGILVAGLLAALVVVPLAAGAEVVSRASVATGGAQATGGGSRDAAISGDGRFVGFSSAATNLVPGDTNALGDVFVHDRVTGTTTRVSVSSNGTQVTGGIIGSGFLGLNADGRFVVFTSDATNLVPGATNATCDTNNDMAFTDKCFDVYVRDRLAGTTTRVSVATDGTQGNGNSFGRAISGDGRFVAFSTEATNLGGGCPGRGVYVHDRSAGTTTCVNAGAADDPVISADGRFVAFAVVVPGGKQVLLHDRTTGVTTLVRSNSGRPAVSADGRFVAFETGVPVSGPPCPGLCIAVFERMTGATNIIANPGHLPGISADGRFVVFQPSQTHPDVFVHDRLTGTTSRVNTAPDGTPANAGSLNLDNPGPAISADGRSVAFESAATNLVPNDTNGLQDIFVARLAAGPNWLVTGADAGGGPHVRGFDATGAGTPLSFFPYPTGFTGGVRVAVGDVNGDGVPDLITGAGPGGGPHVQAFSGIDRALLMSFFAYAPGFTGGVYVAAGDVNGDGKADVITGADAGGGPHVQVFSGADGTLLQSFFAYSAAFTGGVRVAAGDVNGDGLADIITGAGPGGGPHVRAVSGANPTVELASFFAYPAAFTGGVYVAAGDVNGDGLADIITGAGPGGGPHVRAVSGANPTVELASFFAYPAAFTGGVRVAAGDINGDGLADIITGAGPGGGPHIRAFDAANPAVELASFFAFTPAFTGGVFISGIQR